MDEGLVCGRNIVLLIYCEVLLQTIKPFNCLLLNIYIIIIVINIYLLGGTVVSAVASQHEVPGVLSSNLVQGVSVWSFYVLLVSVCIVSGFSSFLPQSKNMQTGGQKVNWSL